MQSTLVLPMKIQFTLTPEDLLALQMRMSGVKTEIANRKLGKPTVWAWIYAGFVGLILVSANKGDYWQIAADLWPLELGAIIWFLLSLSAPALSRYKARNDLQKLTENSRDDDYLGPCTLRITSKSISARYTNSKFTANWCKVTAVDNFEPQRIYIRLGLAGGIVIPRREFHSDATYTELTEFLKNAFAQSAA
jgi:hypothetical protein